MDLKPRRHILSQTYDSFRPDHIPIWKCPKSVTNSQIQGEIWFYEAKSGEDSPCRCTYDGEDLRLETTNPAPDSFTVNAGEAYGMDREGD